MENTNHLKRYKNPKIIGPGIWFMGHLLAEDAVSSRNLDDFNSAYMFFLKLRDKFPCKKCKDHIEIYFNKNPIQKYAPTNTKKHDPDGLAKWFYGLHENANTFTGNKSEKYEDVQNFFAGLEFCEDECTEQDVHDEGITRVSTIPSPPRTVS